MKYVARFLLALAAMVVVVPTVAQAHFKLLEPASWLIENDRGDPQKAGPCGGSNVDWGKPSNIVSKVVGGQKVHVKIQETIYHPGFYRIALAMNSRNDLPIDPEAQTKPSEKGPVSVSATVSTSPVAPILADGLFMHHTRPEAGQQLPPWETDVQLPNINCAKCTLQVVQFMEEHGFNNPGGFTYHHCAELQITADPKKPLEKDWPATH